MTNPISIRKNPTLSLAARLGILAVLGTAGISANAGGPVGYERWTEPYHSVPVFGETCAGMQDRYNHPNVFGPYKPEADIAKFYRLIDIEVRRDPHQNGQVVYDGVAIQNTDAFELPSWLICDMTRKELVHHSRSKKSIAVDIERYDVQGEERWAAIFQLTKVDTDWRLIFHETAEDIDAFAHIDESRVLDIDWHDWKSSGEGCTKGSAEACFPYDRTYHAVVLKNEGVNQVNWELAEVQGDESGASPLIPAGMQLVDRELSEPMNALFNDWNDPSLWVSAMLWVEKPNLYKTLENQNEGAVFINHAPTSRVVDIEWSMRLDEENPGFFETWFHTVNADLP